MSKPTKKDKTPVNSQKESILDVCSDAAAIGVTALRTRIQAIADDIATADQDQTSHLAWITKYVAQIGGEQRKIEAEARKARLDLTLDAVRSFLLAMDPNQWEHLKSEVDLAKAGGSVLG